MPTAPGWRRLAAFAVDYVFLLGYVGLLFVPGLGLRGLAGRRSWAPPDSRAGWWARPPGSSC